MLPNCIWRKWMSGLYTGRGCLCVAVTATLTPLFFLSWTSIKHGETTGNAELRQAEMAQKIESSKYESLWGLFIGDSLAMPVHWFYNPEDIKRSYGGWLTAYMAPNRRHPSSILTLSAIGGSGRSGWGSKSKGVIGNVILHDKLKYWTNGDRHTHYHQGMSAGDSTLNALTALQTMRTMQTVDPDATMEPRLLRSAVLQNYVKFMTTPGSHEDTYAESFHRLFFKDWAALENPPTVGEQILDFTELRYKNVSHATEDNQIPVIGSLVLAVPWVLHYANQPEEDCAVLTTEAIKMTHPAPSLEPYVMVYAKLLHAVIHGADLRDEILKAAISEAMGGKFKQDRILKMSAEASRYIDNSESLLEACQDATSMLGSACYIQGALSSLLFLAYQFHDDFTAGVLTNANCGGENAHRGAALGALLGAATIYKDLSVPQKWKDGLNSAKDDIQAISMSKL